MARQGVGTVLIYDFGDWAGIPTVKGPVDFLGPQWRELFRHTVSEADRLGLKVNVDNCSGYNAGGPWIKAEHAEQRLIWSEKRIAGPAKIDGVLPMPGPVVDNHYREVAVLAFRMPEAVDGQMNATQSSTGFGGSAGRAIDGNPDGAFGHNSISHTGPGDVSPWWQLDLGEETRIDEIEIWRRTDPAGGDLQLNGAEVVVLDGKKQEVWRKNVGVLKDPGLRLKVEAGSAKARYVRIEKPGNYLSIAEVLVFSGGKNIVHGKPRKEFQDWEIKAARKWVGPSSQYEPSWQQPDAIDAPDFLPGSMVDLSKMMDSTGKLVWDVPEGNWVVLRFGHTMYPLCGPSLTKGSNAAGAGYEVDPFSSEALDLHFSALAEKLADDAGPLAGKVVKNFFIDSWESGAATWTPRFRAEFQRLRGYDLLPYLPVLAGRIVQSVGVSERFLWDYRRTIGDLFAENFYGRTAELLHGRGLGLQAEAYGGHFDVLENLGRTDVPCGEFWAPLGNLPDGLPDLGSTKASGRPIEASVKAAASAGHTYGKPVISATGFINYDKWQVYPFLLKAYGDRAFCEGINWMYSSATAQQPKLDEKPGICPPWGAITDRNTTWWEQSHAWHDYLTRCSFLLQQGLYVADLCAFRGEGVPDLLRMDPSQFPAGYSYDECNAEVILTRMSVKDGRIMLPDGMSYRMLVLPDERSMTPRVLRKIAELVEAGATVVGPKPLQSPSLENYPACDKEVSGLADKVWGPCDGKAVKEHAYGKGKVVWGKPLQEVLLSENIRPDFEYVSSQNDPVVRWIHRNDQGTDIYFVANQRNRPEELDVTFRVSGKAPELWHPDTGMITRPEVYDEVGGRTRMPLRLDPLGSVFVVFRDPAKADRIVSLSKDGKTLFPGGTWPAKETPLVEVLEEEAGPVMKIWSAGKYELKTASGKSTTVESGPVAAPLEIDGPWEVKFPEGLGAPASAVFDKLTSWTTHPETGIKYFSGMATYVKDIEIPADMVGKGKSLYLDLGKVKELAEVRLNGKDLGVLWKPPFRMDISQAVKPGKNLLEVKVTNLWPNRLIGDQFVPEAEQITRTNDKSYKKESRLLESGLLGPVRIQSVDSRRIETKK